MNQSIQIYTTHLSFTILHLFGQHDEQLEVQGQLMLLTGCLLEHASHLGRKPEGARGFLASRSNQKVR